MHQLLIISHDIVTEKLAGPGMRYLEMARALSRDLEVILAIPGETSLQVPGLRFAPYRFEQPAEMYKLVQACDVILISSFILEKFPLLTKSQNRIVVDLYDPTILENLHLYEKEPMGVQEVLNTQVIQFTNRLLQSGDFFICGNERQRDFWLGMLAANGRLTPRAFSKDPTLRPLIDVVGVGMPERKPTGGPFLRGIHPRIQTDSRIVLWGGGIWDWMDPLTLIRAWPQVLKAHPLARLVFLGTRHPNPLVPPHSMAQRAQNLAEEIGEKDQSIIFYDWLSYAQREALLCEADVGVMLHSVHIETRYSIRTRIFDYFWACLPILITAGDVTSEWVEQYRLGEVVAAQDVEITAMALSRLLEKPKSAWAQAYGPLHELFSWTQVVKPLLHFCLQGDTSLYRTSPQTSKHSSDLKTGLARARYILKNEGWPALVSRCRDYLKWKISQR
jgi:glycosyltransferase involved in cell wall biosynthesis